MPYQQPVLSWLHIRDFCEKFAWKDSQSGLLTEGYNPPAHALNAERVPFSIKYITGKGVVEQGRCVCVKVDRKLHQRLVMFVDSGEFRRVRDYLVMEINGTRFVTRSISM